MTAIQDLISRLEKAEGPDDLIDAEIPVLLGVWSPPRGYTRDPGPDPNGIIDATDGCTAPTPALALCLALLRALEAKEPQS